ncbi:MAG: amidohydrolase family protein [Sphingomonadaceae bacterium]|nr:amidohydrolase family protein [Sphingomonadaceae bacterium]
MDAWQALAPEPVLDAAQPVVDAHHHIELHGLPDYDLTSLRKDVGSGHNVAATVYMECAAHYRENGPPAMAPVGETEWVAAITRDTEDRSGPRLAAGIVGFADLLLGDAVAEVLEAHVAAGDGRFRGIRQMTASDPGFSMLLPPRPPGMLADDGFRRGFARLAPLGLSFDAFVYHPQLREVAALADAFPETVIILDHIGTPLAAGPYAGRREEVFEPWRRDISMLGERLNVRMKLGGFGMFSCGFGFEDHAQPASSAELAAAWKPYAETCLAAFGADRCMFESNFPVDRQSASYRLFWNALKRIAAGWSPGERQAMLHDTAARAYRLATQHPSSPDAASRPDRRRDRDASPVRRRRPRSRDRRSADRLPLQRSRPRRSRRSGERAPPPPADRERSCG